MSLRLKLLLMSLATLVLPWAGCRYAREMESALHEGERAALDAMAQTIAASLQGRNDLLYRDPYASPVAKAGPLDLQPILLAGEPYLDGYAEEWPTSSPNWRSVTRGKDSLRILTGVHERMLYLLLEVRDNRLIFDSPAVDPLDSASIGDRVWIGYQDPEGADRHVFISATSAGSVRGKRIETREFGQKVAVDEPRIQGAWQPMTGGYRVELRIPMSMLSTRLGVLIDDRDERGAAPASFGTLGRDDLRIQGRFIAASPSLNSYLQQFMQPGLRLTVTTPDGSTLALADALEMTAEYGVDRGILARLYRRILETPGDRQLLEASRVIKDAERRRDIGRLAIAQTAERWLNRRDRALTRLLNFTLITSALAVLGMFAFAARLAFRLARLRRASESALTRDGLVTTFPETAVPDELGDMARSFSTLLARLAEYTGYLRTLAGKLAHEIRTPLTIVRSSLENLESEGISSGARVYLERAREGSERLNTILVAMGAASRVEEAIQNAERTRFNVVPVIASAVDSYRIAFPQRNFDTELPGEPLEIEGAPDLIVQMLDKLVDNAVDFSPAGATITVRLRVEPDAAVLEVDNPGPTLAPESRGRLFESLWQSRSGSDSRPHFGLGLYIVRLIAEFHGGKAEADDLPDASGARFSVWLAR